MRFLPVVLVIPLLTSCAALMEGAIAGEIGETALVRAAALSPAAAEAAGATMFVDAGAFARIPAEGRLSTALRRLKQNGNRLVIRDGAIRSGPQSVAELSGAKLYSLGELVGYLDDGMLVDETSGRAIGRLRGILPARGGVLQFSDGTRAANERSMLVDILSHRDGGGYSVRLASGETASYFGPLAAITLTAAALLTTCPLGHGVAVRTSGETIVFDQCDRQGDGYILQKQQDTVVADARELKGFVSTGRARGEGSGGFAAAKQGSPATALNERQISTWNRERPVGSNVPRGQTFQPWGSPTQYEAQPQVGPSVTYDQALRLDPPAQFWPQVQFGPPIQFDAPAQFGSSGQIELRPRRRIHHSRPVENYQNAPSWP